ncbi:MAG: alanyl-tRNA editing protein [Faecalibacterium sp.]
MQRTEKYFEQNAYRREAVGHILAAEPDSRTGGGRIALDGTVFYPEGGGQPADRGTLTLADGTVLTVTDVHEQAGVIWHMVTSLPAGAVPGAEAAQAIDWAWRFDKMQQHTGEHILSGILHSMFGAENVGFHIGSDAVRMDTNIPVSAEGLKAAETAANRIIWENVPVSITYPTREELAALTYRSKKEIEGQVRIVTIPGADVCACCGTHTAFTGAVGQIKILAAENYKGGVRLSVVCGGRALEAAQAMRARQAEIGALLSAKASETANAVHRVYDEYTALKFTHFGLCSQLFDALAAQVTPGADAIRIVPGAGPGRPAPAGCPPDRSHHRPVRGPDPQRKGHRLLPCPGRRRCPCPDQSPERRPQWPRRRQTRHLSGKLRRRAGTGGRIFAGARPVSILALSGADAPAPPKGEPLAKPVSFPHCQGLSLWERWICEAKTERASHVNFKENDKL